MTKFRINYRHYICIVITLGFIACGVFVFPNAVGRLVESGRDLGLSIGYYFCEIFGIEHSITPTVTEFAEIPFFSFVVSSEAPSTSLPETWTGFKTGWSEYWSLWASADNVLGYLDAVANVLFIICEAIIISIPFVMLLYFAFSRYLKKYNNDYNKDSTSVRILKWTTAHTYRPVRSFVISLVTFIRERKPYWLSWLCLWLLYFNATAIFVEFVAYYLYFVASFDVVSIYSQVYKLFVDLAVPVGFIPVWVWIIIGLILFDRFRKRIGYARLNHMEMRNRGFINGRPIVFMDCGTMGKKKTTMITDMAISQEIMFRDKAFEKILENDLKFPFFPWCMLENEIKRGMENHTVYNLATCKRFVNSKKAKFYKLISKGKCSMARYKCLYNYDNERYGFTYNDELTVVDVWDIIYIYAQLYFIYVIESSLIISNYSIRVDNVLADLGNFPIWNSELFERDTRLMDSYSRHAHILDYDTLRLGKKVIENNPNADNFEFGIVLITEIGKERGNQFDMEGKKKTDDRANQKNDLLNYWLKMVRHSATVDNFPFVRVITDEQRPESWAADARNLCDIVHIRESGETKLAMPFFTMGELLYSFLFGRFAKLYYKYRYVRSDNTLPMYILKFVTAKLEHYYKRIYNRFGFCVLRIQTESGTQDGEIFEHNYYLMHKKIYSKRFSTDCFSDFFMRKSLRSPNGIDDIPEYETEKASFEELKQQNSYFVNDLLTGLMDNVDSSR